MQLGDVAYYPTNRVSVEILTDNTYVSVENLLKDKQGKCLSTCVPTEGNVIEYKTNDILIGNIRPYLRKIWLANNNGGTNADVVLVRILESQTSILQPKFLYHILSDEKFFEYNNQYAKGAKMPRGDKSMILKYIIPIPPLDEQERIVAILDKFDSLVNDISEGLPAEINARKQQYEHYRNKLLTFDEAA